MEGRLLDITVISAEGLKNVNHITKMDVYVVVSITGTKTKCRTNPDRDAGSHPRWNHRMQFSIDEPTLTSRSLLFVIKSDRTLRNKDIGEVSIPLIDLLDNNTSDPDADERVVDYQVSNITGKPRGTLRFSYKFGEKTTLQLQPNTIKSQSQPPTPYLTPPHSPYGVGPSYPAPYVMSYGVPMPPAPYYGPYLPAHYAGTYSPTPPPFGLSYPCLAPPQYAVGYNGYQQPLTQPPSPPTGQSGCIGCQQQPPPSPTPPQTAHTCCHQQPPPPPSPPPQQSAGHDISSPQQTPSSALPLSPQPRLVTEERGAAEDAAPNVTNTHP